MLTLLLAALVALLGSLAIATLAVRLLAAIAALATTVLLAAIATAALVATAATLVTAAATTVATATLTEATTTATAGAVRGLIDADSAAIEPSLECQRPHNVHVPDGDLLLAIHVGDGVLGIGIVGVTDKAEATAATGITVLDDNLSEAKRFN